MDPHNPRYGEQGAIYGQVFYSAGASENPQTKKRKPMADIKQNLSRQNPTQLIQLADNQAKLMAPAAPKTPPIPNMAATIAELVTAQAAAKTANDAYEQAKAALASLKTVRDNAADALRTKLGETATKAASESKGDPTMLQAAGYQLANATPPPTPGVVQPLNLVVTAGDMDGAVDVSCDPPAHTRTFEWQVTTGDPMTGPYHTAKQTSASSTTLTGLTSGSRIWVRVRAIGTKGEGPWSDPATKIVP